MYFSQKSVTQCSFKSFSITNNNDVHPFMFRGVSLEVKREKSLEKMLIKSQAEKREN